MQLPSISSFPLFRLFVAGGLALACSGASATLLKWDAAADYSQTQSAGVNGVWSYGTTGLSLTGAFTQFNLVGGVDSFSRWNGGPALPNIGSAIGRDFSLTSIHFPANTIGGHPGEFGEYAVLRFTAPAEGHYQVAAAFWGNDTASGTAGYVVNDGRAVFQADVGRSGLPAISWSGVLELAAGEFVDFAIGDRDNNITRDYTGFSAVITQTAGAPSGVPEPSGLALLLTGGALLGLMRRRRKAADAI